VSIAAFVALPGRAGQNAVLPAVDMLRYGFDIVSRGGRFQVEHERFSLCYAHYEDQHEGPWESCQKCRDFWSPRYDKLYAEKPINWPRY